MRVALLTGHLSDDDGLGACRRAIVDHAPDDIRVELHAGCSSIRTRALGARLAAARVDAIHVFTSLAGVVAARHVAGRLPVPLIASWPPWTLDHRGPGALELARVHRALARRILRSCVRVVLPSAAHRAQLATAGWGENVLLVSPPGVDADRFTPGRRSPALRAAWRVSDDGPAILYAGPLGPGRDLDVLARLHRLLVEHRLAHRLIVCGDGPWRDRLARDLPDAVFTGGMSPDRLGVVMASCDLFVLPGDGDGGTVLEAQAAGLPALVAETAPALEQMHDRITGFACARGSERAFGCRAVELIVDRARRRAMAHAARAWALTRAWPLVLRPLFQSYRDAVTGSPQCAVVRDGFPSSRWTRRSITRAS